MDHVEVVGPAEDGVERGQDVRTVLGGSPGRTKCPLDRRHEPAGGRRIAAGEHGHVVAAPIELANELVDDPLGTAVARRRDGLERRRDLGDPEASADAVHRSSLPRPAGPVDRASSDRRADQPTSRSRRRSTWSTSSASRARAPATISAGARDVNASLASRARAASSRRSASASSRSSRTRSAAAESASAGFRPDPGLEVAGDDRQRTGRLVPPGTRSGRRAARAA